jgi:hypothetical protein
MLSVGEFVEMRIQCRRCGRTIEPEEPMVVVVVDQLAQWSEPDRIAARVELAHGRWHYHCAPVHVKRWASAVMPPKATTA